VGSTRVLGAALDPRTGPTGRHIGRSACGELALRGVFLAFEGGKRAARKVVWPSPDDVDHLLKLTRCEFGRDLVSRAVYGHQE
jgi:hypothetical protein